LSKTTLLRRFVDVGTRLAVALCAVVGGGTLPGVALLSCGPTQRPNGIGQCHTCDDIVTKGSLGADKLSAIFNFAGIQQANYKIVNNVGTFSIAGTNLALFNFSAPPSAPVLLAPVQGSIPVVVSLSYTAFPRIPDLSLTWSEWTGSVTGVTVNALLSGHIDIHLSADPIVVNPRLTLTNLPVTITFGSDAKGNAAILPSQIAVASIGPHGSVDNCGAFDWCDGLARKLIEEHVHQQLANSIAQQFTSALNAKTPFWKGFLHTLANLPASPIVAIFRDLKDPAGFTLPLINQQTSGGMTKFWNVFPGDFVYADSKITATFDSSGGLCYIDCTPKRTQAQVCGANSCGKSDDGCQNTITCQGTCASNEVCENNKCKVCIPRTCADVGFVCGFPSNGCGGALSCQTCGTGTTCKQGVCVGFGGPDGKFCKDCEKSGGHCKASSEGTNSCIFQ
jgi:hypothetical protein